MYLVDTNIFLEILLEQARKITKTGLTLVTMDKDFKSVQHEIQVLFL